MTKAPVKTSKPWIATGLIGLLLASAIIVLLVAINVPINRRG
jgi:hypothetical protein